jgi:hypothetical protein
MELVRSKCTGYSAKERGNRWRTRTVRPFKGYWTRPKPVATALCSRPSPRTSLWRTALAQGRGDTFENLAVYVTRRGADDKADRLWTDLDTEACLEFWARNRTGLAANSPAKRNE